jgi:FKBP-type peptidyl-prolyl cis-trans isomerase SlpA
LSLADGTVVDSTNADEPITYTVGNGDLVAFLEQRLLGLQAGEQRHYEISAADSQIPVDADAVQHMARSDFPTGLVLEPGQVMGFTAPSGDEVPGLIVSVSDREVVVDFSHPLAGRDLIFDVTILAIESI